MEFGYVLEHHADVTGVKWTLILGLVGGVLEDYGFAEVVDGGGVQDLTALLEGFGVVGVVCDHHVDTPEFVLLGPCQQSKAGSFGICRCLQILDTFDDMHTNKIESITTHHFFFFAIMSMNMPLVFSLNLGMFIGSSCSHKKFLFT